MMQLKNNGHIIFLRSFEIGLKLQINKKTFKCVAFYIFFYLTNNTAECNGYTALVSITQKNSYIFLTRKAADVIIQIKFLYSFY